MIATTLSGESVYVMTEAPDWASPVQLKVDVPVDPSKYDVKQEYKQSEGDPHTKGQRKQLAHEIAFGGGPSNVKNADAVLATPQAKEITILEALRKVNDCLSN